MTQIDGPVADATGNWVDRFAPEQARPYLRLARFDRPIGAWLLLIPCWWAAGLAGARLDGFPNLAHLALFFVGAFVMRAAGCTWNDIVDRDLDGRVERTRSRPIPSGQVTVQQAVLFMAGLALVGLIVLLQFNRFTIALGIGSLILVMLYPFLKRITYWPQLGLGLVFSWGALIGWAAVFGRLGAAPLLLYAGTMAWVIGYDTIYAHQDREDDALVGVKSTALLFGEQTKPALAFFYTMSVLLIGLAAWRAGVGPYFVIGLSVFAFHLAWQVRQLDIADSALCLRIFKSNRDAGLLLFAGILLDALARAVS